VIEPELDLLLRLGFEDSVADMSAYHNLKPAAPVNNMMFSNGYWRSRKTDQEWDKESHNEMNDKFVGTSTHGLHFVP